MTEDELNLEQARSLMHWLGEEHPGGRAQVQAHIQVELAKANPFDAIPDDWYLDSLMFTTNILPWLTRLRDRSDDRCWAQGYGATPSQSIREAGHWAAEAVQRNKATNDDDDLLSH